MHYLAYNKFQIFFYFLSFSYSFKSFLLFFVFNSFIVFKTGYGLGVWIEALTLRLILMRMNTVNASSSEVLLLLCVFDLFVVEALWHLFARCCLGLAQEKHGGRIRAAWRQVNKCFLAVHMYCSLFLLQFLPFFFLLL